MAFAHGLQDPGHGAEPVVSPKPDGGWVFSMGSLCFNGALADDPAMARILRNAVEAAVRQGLESLHVEIVGAPA